MDILRPGSPRAQSSCPEEQRWPLCSWDPTAWNEWYEFEADNPPLACLAYDNITCDPSELGYRTRPGFRRGVHDIQAHLLDGRRLPLWLYEIDNWMLIVLLDTWERTVWFLGSRRLLEPQLESGPLP